MSSSFLSTMSKPFLLHLYIKTTWNTLFSDFRSTPILMNFSLSVAFQVLHKILSSPSHHIWRSLLWSETLLFLTLYSFPKFLNQSIGINYHRFANKSQFFTSCPELSSGLQTYISCYSSSSYIPHKFLKFSMFITNLVFFTQNLCFLFQRLHHQSSRQCWKLRDTLTLLPSPSPSPRVQIPFFLKKVKFTF